MESIDSHFKKYTFLQEEEENNDTITGGVGEHVLLAYKGGLSLEKTLKTNNPTVSQFKDLIVPIGLVLNTNVPESNYIIEDDIETEPISETKFNTLFTLANGVTEKPK